ncbi:3' terminal RNA ribose 2'-O-methyltransferase Hen1 [Deinococcus maricopensis]|uniref:Small RNA 2'-O-methyltransferase n=1 Tax=Deinococcus maricopensis (strain DSM 21211 / LMG 22137 / NRRL B-23946 / LB-34) TaxID=709986 RepID=E8U4N9_DEIML|nr:3' terminal RNA ribose 2'-O-methyltransferase Hen1 [Deinococcus maricopensis]ADV68904.1 Methyltransferase type 12 [Deinococcus maricopensis DSM 21211]
MLLTIATTHAPARDLGFLLHKHPDHPYSTDLPFGTVHVFAPEATDARTAFTLLLDVDPVRLSRRARPGGAPLEPYVNDRPYVPGSFMSVALNAAYRTALTGRCTGRPELADVALPLTATLPAVPARADDGDLDAGLVERLFAPLGYSVHTARLPLDEQFPEWGDSPYLNVTLHAPQRVQDLLQHLYVLLPVLDNAKHYFIGEDEIEKLLRHAGGWLDTHPERAFITRRYLRFRAYARAALGTPAPAEPTEPRGPTLNEQRYAAVHAALRAAGAVTVLDLGCGEGKFLARLAGDPQFRRVTGVDVSVTALRRARERLGDTAPHVTLLHGALTYRDPRLRHFDAATLVEVIEHLDPPRLHALTASVLGDARPATVIVTTPNVEYNAVWGELGVRHADHRFEWTREEFRAWADASAAHHGYRVTLSGIGDEHPTFGPPTQMATFTREGPA